MESSVVARGGGQWLMHIECRLSNIFCILQDNKRCFLMFICVYMVLKVKVDVELGPGGGGVEKCAFFDDAHVSFEHT